MWAMSSTALMARFPVLAGIEAPDDIADRDQNGAASDGGERGAVRSRAAGREVTIKQRQGRFRRHQRRDKRGAMTRTYDNDAQLEDVPVEDAIERARNKREKRAKTNGTGSRDRARDQGAPQIGEKPTIITLTWHGEDTDEPLVEWAVEDMAYMIGVGSHRRPVGNLQDICRPRSCRLDHDQDALRRASGSPTRRRPVHSRRGASATPNPSQRPGDRKDR